MSGIGTVWDLRASQEVRERIAARSVPAEAPEYAALEAARPFGEATAVTFADSPHVAEREAQRAAARVGWAVVVELPSGKILGDTDEEMSFDWGAYEARKRES